MGNGNHRNWGYHLDEEDYTPRNYIPTMNEFKILCTVVLLDQEGEIKRQRILCDGVDIGFIQLGFGPGESYLIKPNWRRGEKLRLPKTKAIYELARIYLNEC